VGCFLVLADYWAITRSVARNNTIRLGKSLVLKARIESGERGPKIINDDRRCLEVVVVGLCWLVCWVVGA